MSIWKNVSPSGAVAEFATVFQQAGPKRWPIAALSAAITVGMVSMLAGESWKMPRKLPEITYITTFPDDWTTAESLEFRKERQRQREEQEAAMAKADKETRELWEALGRASGMDVDKIKAKAEADRLAAEKAKAAQDAEARKKAGLPPVEQQR
ncbi:MAG TPA: hypothetical protein PKN09_05985 [Novosphingobium sp.]|nr:hypothetical protein [Novosphingobium sp.]